MCRGAMLSKKESILRLGKSKKNDATKEHPASLVFTNMFMTHSTRDIFVIKLERHTCLHKAMWHAVWHTQEQGYGPQWPEVPRPSLTRPVDGFLDITLLGTSDPG